MTQALPKADLIFEFTRFADGKFVGTLHAPSSDPELTVVHEGAFTHEAWVRFVVRQICACPHTPRVAFMLTKPDGAQRPYFFDPRTVEQIRVQSLTSEDLIL
jgi:hypothetical protein